MGKIIILKPTVLLLQNKVVVEIANIQNFPQKITFQTKIAVKTFMLFNNFNFYLQRNKLEQKILTYFFFSFFFFNFLVDNHKHCYYTLE